ncbi:MAG: 50S ribosomal protein L30 [Armatimonadetes bacterium]|nr:50S ribosomal protein L30 [Armatimonadota bacterium]
MTEQKLRVTLKRSLICQKPKLRRTALALGLRRPNDTVVVADTADMRGMLRVVEHMIAVEPAQTG